MAASKETATPAEKEQKVIPVSDLVPVYQLIEAVAKNAVALVDISVQRGAVKGEELSAIAGLRDNAVKLIKEYENFHSALED